MYQSDLLIYRKWMKDQLLIKEELFDADELLETRNYNYNSNNNPDLVTAADGNNEYLYTEQFYYHSQGPLVQIIRTNNTTI